MGWLPSICWLKGVPNVIYKRLPCRLLLFVLVFSAGLVFSASPVFAIDDVEPEGEASSLVRPDSDTPSDDVEVPYASDESEGDTDLVPDTESLVVEPETDPSNFGDDDSQDQQAEELEQAGMPSDSDQSLSNGSAAENPSLEPAAFSGWKVSTDYGHGLQRYWFENGVMVKNRLIEVVTGKVWAFARPEGYVVRGRWTDPATGYVYLADNEGKLENVGWCVSDKYGQGLQRYYIDSALHAAIPGYSSEGWNHYTRPEGYVARSSFIDSDGASNSADNNGKVNVFFPSDGWVVTQRYNQGLQRYWFENHRIVKDRLIQTSASTWAYARPEGYVVRGRWADSDTGHVYLANNEGRLENPGWLVSQAYGQGLQRYWIDSAVHAAVPGYSADGWKHYTLPAGYVARGSFTDFDGKRGTADNNGLVTSFFPKVLDGWYVTSDYGQGLQRYWMSRGLRVKDRLIQTSASTWAYARPEGFVVRGRWKHPSTGFVYLAGNDGRLENPGWLVSQAYGQGLQRYWIDAKAHAAVPGYSEESYPHFTRDEGYVLRGRMDVSNGYMLADNNGRLDTTENEGVHITLLMHHIAWAGQPNNYYCGPTAGYIVLRYLGAGSSGYGSLTISNVARAMMTDSYGYTSFADRRFESGIESWLGRNIYTTIAQPSYETVREAVIRSFELGIPVVVDEGEVAGGPHFNAHGNTTFSHLMVVAGYNTETDAVLFVDPGSTLWAGSQNKFWYPSLRRFTDIHLHYGTWAGRTGIIAPI